LSDDSGPTGRPTGAASPRWRALLNPIMSHTMKTFFSRAAFAALAIAAVAPTVRAQDGDIVQRIEITASQASLAAAEVVLATRDFDTTYAMSTRRPMTVTRFGDGGLLLRYARRAPTVVRHDGSGTFVSHDGLLALQFALDATGDPSTVKLAMPASWQ
jgi:hypothetical protein